jgi:iron complex outermembrane receptor protein
MIRTQPNFSLFRASGNGKNQSSGKSHSPSMLMQSCPPRVQLGRVFAGALLVAALSASAQTATPPAPTNDQPVQLETFMVTGYRASLQKSLDAKREATAIVDVITAEDVGKFPDTNVAESLAHFTGISIDHVFGEGEMVSILGTDPALNRVLVNGQTIASGQWGGSTNDSSGRTFNYTLLSPEIIGQAELYKATEARIDEGSIGGTVIIHTRRPLDLPSNTVRASAGYAYNDRSEKGNWRGSLLGSWRTADKKFGILAAVTHDKEFLYRAGIEYWGYGTVSGTAGGVYKVPFGMNSAFFKQERKRDGFQGAVQWKPTDTLEFNVTGVYIKGSYDNFSQSRYVVPAYWGTLDSYKTQGDQVVSGHVTAGNATVNGVTLVGPAANPYNADGQYDTNLRKAPVATQSVNVHGDYRPDGTWHVGFDAGHTQATGGKDPEYLFSLMFNQNFSFAYDGSKSSLTFDNAGVATDPTAYKTRQAIPTKYIVNGQYVNVDNGDNGRYQAGGIEYTTTKDKEDYGQIDADRPVAWGPFNKVLFGGKYTDHVNAQYSRGNFIPVTSILDLNSFKPSASPTNLFDGVGTTGDTAKMVVPDQNAVVSYLLNQPQGAMEEKKGQEWYVREQNSAAYLQANFAESIYSGNLGVRLVHTKDESKYWNYDGPTATYSKVKKDTSYTKVLPSGNFVVDAAKDLKVRLGVSKVIARPRYSDLAGQFSVDNTRLTGSGGNPDLKPYESTNLNIALEYYMGKTGLLSAEFFVRDVGNYVLNVTQDKQLLNTSTGQTATYSISSPFNAGDAKVYGAAFSAQKDLAYGFGIQSNVTISRSDTTNGYAMPYLSRTTYNIIPYYENGKFSARLSYNWRSEFFTAIGRLNSPMFSDAYKQVDASISYEITKNVQLILNGENLLDSTYFAYYQTKYAPMGVYKTGRMITTSVSLKF